MTDPHARSDPDSRHGALAAIAAYFIWGLVPLYFKAVATVSAFEIIAHRIVWSLLLMAAVLAASRNAAGLALLRRQPRLWLALAASALLVSSNWLVFVWAVNSGRVLETSLGYYINPLVSVFLAALLLRERLRPLQWAAVALAAAGVVNQIVALAALPWISLTLAVTFALYGLLRKRIPIDAASGLFVETLLVAPFALAYLAHLAAAGQLAFLNGPPAIDGLIVASGLITSLPLVLFAYGARRLRLTTLGFLQYLAPSLTFLLAVSVFGEPFGGGQLVSFALIWVGLAVYTVDLLRSGNRSP